MNVHRFAGVCRPGTFLLLLAAAIGWSTAVSAAVYKVGDPITTTHHTHTSIQAALDAALLNNGPDEVRVLGGIYDENISLAIPDDEIVLTGGWNATFDRRSADPALTVVNGGGIDTVLQAFVAQGAELMVQGFTFTNGLAQYLAGGVNLDVGGTVRFSNNVVSNNVSPATTPDPKCGAGLTVIMRVPGTAIVTENVLAGNEIALGSGTYGFGAGFCSLLIDGGTLRVLRNRITNNSITGVGTGDRFGAGVGILGTMDQALPPGASVEFSGNEVSSNQLSGTFAADHLVVAGTGIRFAADPPVNLVIRRNIWKNNSNLTSASGSDVFVQNDGGVTRFSDSSITAGTGDGLAVTHGVSGEISLTNITVADNLGTGLTLSRTNTGSTNPLSLYNTIVFNNGAEVDMSSGGTIDAANNLIGTDPLFSGPADYRITSGSAAENTGNKTPPGGLGARDLAERPRVFGTAVDIGAYERSHCDNGSIDEDEMNVDCGGTDCLPCTCGGGNARSSGGQQFTTIQAAYDAAMEGGGPTVELREHKFVEHVFLDQPGAIVLRGGHDCAFLAAETRYTRVAGSVTVNGGPATITNLVVQ